MAYNSFEQVNSLGETERRTLLQQGDPSERVWAAWSLGLEFGASLNPDLIQSLNQAPHPGTRRHLVIILAGHGEKALVTTIAKHDPDEIVRATACQYLIQTAATKDAELENLLKEILASEKHPSVHKVVLDNASNGFPKLADKELVPLTKSSDLAVRRLAVALLMVQMPIREFASLVDSHVLEGTDGDLRMQLAEAYGDTSSLFKMTTEAPEALRPEIMRELMRVDPEAVWYEVGFLSELGNPRIDYHLVLLLADAQHISKAFHWLMCNIDRMINWQSPRSLAESDQFYYASACALLSEELLFDTVLDMDQLQPIDIDLDMLDRIIQNLERYRQPMSQPDQLSSSSSSWFNLADKRMGLERDDRLWLLNELKLLRENMAKN
ncbi:MAG: HEAT repeat domain-containing protein [Anaerolineae bacterium]|nr:HEAT repeat domain-containing protein [Anaerolineae bacterium]